MVAEHVFTGFGFGPIQGGLFAKETFQSGNFKRIVVAEIDAELVDAVRINKGSYYVNIARADGIETLQIDNVELLNPNVTADRRVILEALTQSTEIVTCLPSIGLYGAGGAEGVASLIAEGLKNSSAKATIIYTAENNNHAAEILEKAVSEKNAALSQGNLQFLNTVIGKMSRVVTDPAEIAELKLKTIAPGLDRAFLVEQFNRILVSRTRIAGFKPGIEIFIEKDDLLPFEEAKLYGHNAIHSLLGFIGAVKGIKSMTELKGDKAVMQIGRDAFLKESGAVLIKKYAYLGDELFTEDGFKNYAEDLLERMTNPYLGDTIARVTRDVVRKLEMDGRIFGTIQLALKYGIEPKNMALGALAGIAVLLDKAEEYDLPNDMSCSDWSKLDQVQIEKILKWLWNGKSFRQIHQIIKYLKNAKKYLREMTTSENLELP
jgi:mannitol-1-phosphate/altronate dehydrogenase